MIKKGNATPKKKPPINRKLTQIETNNISNL